MFGKGIARSGEVLDLAVDLDIVHKAGSWFSYDGSKLGQGRDTVKKVLEDNPELMEEIETKVLLKKGIIDEVPETKAEKPKPKGKKAESAS